MSLQAAWQGMTDVAGSREGAMMGLKKAFGQYNYAEDPEYQRDMQYLQQNPTRQAAGAFVEKWGDQLDGATMEDITKQLQPMEGTPQWTESQLQENQLAQSNIQTEAMPELTEDELKLSGYKVDEAALNRKWNPRLMEQQYEQGEAQLENALGQNEMIQHELDIMDETKDYQIEDARLQNLSNELGVEAQTIENYIADQTRQDRIDQAGAQARQAVAGADMQETQADVADRTADYEVEDARINNLMNSLGLEQEQRQWDYMKDLPDSTLYGGDSGESETQPEPSGDPVGYVPSEDGNVTVYENPRGGLTYMTQQGEQPLPEEYADEVVDTSEYGQSAIDVEETIPSPEGYESQLSVNRQGQVVDRQTGEPFVDEYGNTYRSQENFLTEEREYISSGDENVFKTTDDYEEIPKKEDTTDKIMNFIFGDDDNGGEETSDAQFDSIDSVIQEFKSNNPDLSYREIAQTLEDNYSDEEFKENTGYSLNSVLGRLRMMR